MNILNNVNTEGFIKELGKQANLDESQCAMVNEIFESNFIAGKENKNVIVGLISEKLGVDEAQADEIYNIAAGILASGILDKIKGIFKR